MSGQGGSVQGGGRGHGAGVVRVWYDEERWGVVDTPDTPGGCWVPPSAIEDQAGLRAGEPVLVEWEAERHEDFAYRAVRVRPRGDETLGATPGG